GNLRGWERRLALDATSAPDWTVIENETAPDLALKLAEPLLEGEIFAFESRYDALGRLVFERQPEGSEMRLSYHESALLARLVAPRPGAPTFTDLVSETEYTAKGQRLSARFGAGVVTATAYDEKTFRIRRMTSRRSSDDKVLQDL